LKYADDANLLVPGNTDVELADEFRHVIQWADDNKKIINQSKTKEIAFRRTSPRRLLMYPSDNGVELVTHTKLLGVWIQDNFKVYMHVDYILSLCSQRIFLMKRLHDHGLSTTYIHTVFQAIIVSRILYALPAL